MKPGPTGPTPLHLKQRRETDSLVLRRIPIGEAKAVTSTEIAAAIGVGPDRIYRSLARLIEEGRIVRQIRPIPWTYRQGGRHSVYTYHREKKTK